MQRKPKKASKKTRPTRTTSAVPRSAQTITLVKKPEKGSLRGQAAVICAVLERHHGKMVVSDLIEALEGKIVTRNKLGMGDVYSMTRPVLISKGLVEVKKS